MNEQVTQPQQCNICGAPGPDLVVPRHVWEEVTRFSAPRMYVIWRCNACLAKLEAKAVNNAP